MKPFINLYNFILATRDSGYKNIASALAELIDNSIEAGATCIHIDIKKNNRRHPESYEIQVTDNGKGMSEDELNLALQFGGSSRFNSREQLGRYGMGLPNSSLSQCRRIEIVTWQNKDVHFTNYLDIDEIIDKKLTALPASKRIRDIQANPKSKSGTIIRWVKCDRITFKHIKSLEKQIHTELGRIFRYAIWRAVKIFIGKEMIQAFDPLYLGTGTNVIGGVPFGEELTYAIKIPDDEKSVSKVTVRFVELPVEDWQILSNDEKRIRQITKKAGVTVLRSEREIDYGWFFMGDKRKENYDDWWRCEIRFNPDLDEVFGVTHTKQEIKETEFMRNILTPDIEKIARTLNSRVRLKFIDAKSKKPTSYAKNQLERNDVYLPALSDNANKDVPRKIKKTIRGYDYIINTNNFTDNIFFKIEKNNDKIELIINKEHIFYTKIYNMLHKGKIKHTATFIKIIEIILFAAGRAEMLLTKKIDKSVLSHFKKEWSDNIKTFCS